MYDSTPAPFGDVTRRWTALDKAERQRQAVRLLGLDCAGDVLTHIDRPGLDAGACYGQLVPAGASGDPIALGWLASTHRPLLIARGRALLEHDPTEWGAVCLEVLHRTLASADLSEATWLRRRVARTLTSNDTLNRAAFNLGQLAGAGLLDLNQVVDELERVAIGRGLGPIETRKTVASGLAAGLQHPRNTPTSPPSASRPADAPVRRIGARCR